MHSSIQSRVVCVHTEGNFFFNIYFIQFVNDSKLLKFEIFLTIGERMLLSTTRVDFKLGKNHTLESQSSES